MKTLHGKRSGPRPEGGKEEEISSWKATRKQSCVRQQRINWASCNDLYKFTSCKYKKIFL